MAKCDCYYQHGTKPVCYGTKEMEECSCGGDESKCNFYPEKRKQKMANEKRLIALDEAKKKFDDIPPFIGMTGKCVQDMLDDVPTVDAVEVVRCKDCKHWSDGVAGCTDHVKCCKIGFYMVGENGYCVYGERRTDGRE